MNTKIMKLIDILCCPYCSSRLQLREGEVYCDNQHIFPINGNVISFVKTSEFDSHWTGYGTRKTPKQKLKKAKDFLVPIVKAIESNPDDCDFNMKAIVLVGNDKIGRKLVSKIRENSDIGIFLDNSSSLARLYKLLTRRRIGIKPLLLMALAEITRKDVVIPSLPKISSNANLVRVCQEYKAQKLFLFRAGLIISKKLLGLGIDVFNVHCARIPEYGGLASIYRALVNKDFEQCATLHKVTEKIDQGEIIQTLPYRLDSSLSYRENEDIAYAAGINLLSSFLRDI